MGKKEKNQKKKTCPEGEHLSIKSCQISPS
jgi:hypothetical protein